MSKPILLTISLLISNRPDTVEKCLKSLSTLRERVPSELILTDTGCGERVREIIEKYADTILEFEWCRDFAKARNLGLEQAKGKWILYLDDDEWFEDTKEIEEFFLSGEYQNYGDAVYIQRNYRDKEGTRYGDAYVSRMACLSEGVKFQYSIHECLVNIKGMRKRFHSYVHHYGYIYDDDKDFFLHVQRNIHPLLEEHKKDAHILRHNAQLAQEYNRIREFIKSIEISKEGVRNFIDFPGNLRDINCLFVNIVNGYIMHYEYGKAIEHAKEYMADKRTNILANAMLCSLLARCLYEQKEYNEAIFFAEEYLEDYQKYSKNEETYLRFTGLFVDKCFEEENYNLVVSCAIRAAIELKDEKQAKKFFDKINFEDEKLRLLVPLIKDVVEAYVQATAEASAIYLEFMNKLLMRAEVTDRIIVVLDEMRRKEPDKLENSVADWRALDSEHWYFKYLQLWTNTGDGAVGADRALLYRELAQIPGAVLPKSISLELWDMLKQDNISVDEFLSWMPYYRWENAALTLNAGLQWKDLQDLAKEIDQTEQKDSMHYLRWQISYMERQIEKENEEDLSIEYVCEQLGEYAKWNRQLYQNIYCQEVFAENAELLPDSCRAALMLENLEILVETEKYAEAVELLKQVRKLVPRLACYVKVYSLWIGELLQKQSQEQKQIQTELQRLAQNIKQQIYYLLEQKQVDAALKIVEQLETMVGSDEELEEIKRQIQTQ